MLDGMNPQTHTRPPGSTGPDGFEDTVKDFWASRPRRPQQGRKIAGVAAGVGYRYGVDPVVIRVALVVTTVLGGVGIAVYLLGWLFLPDERDEVSAIEALFGKGRSGASTLFTLLLCVALIPVLSWTFAGNWFDGGGFIGLALITAAVYLLHRGRGQYNRPVDTRGRTPGVQAAGAPAAFTQTDVPTDEQSDPHAWDPLGAAPLAWDLPDPAPAPAPAPARPVRTRGHRRRSRLGLATFAVALVVAGVGAGLGAAGDEGLFGWFTVPHVIGLVLAVLGVGLVASAFAGGARGLIGWALPLSLVGIVMTTLPLNGWHGGLGSVERTPTSYAALQPSYERAMGSVELNLTQLPGGKPVDLSVQLGMGSATILVPRNADVTYSCSSGVGHVECLGTVTEGSDDLTGSSDGPDGPGGQQINLDVTAGMGSVEVHRV